MGKGKKGGKKGGKGKGGGSGMTQHETMLTIKMDQVHAENLKECDETNFLKRIIHFQGICLYAL